jgi:GTP-binding protein
MLVDVVTIKVKAGDGGHGKTSFIRNSQTSRGGPDGGNGGNGADVYFQGIDDITALSVFQYKKELKGEDGIAGGKNNMFGKNSPPLIIHLPLGTLVKDQNGRVITDITDTTTKFLIAKGGRGGRGNNEFKTSTNQAPRYRELGEKGEEKILTLELKLIADVGIVGLPNAGKSSLLEALTNAKPRIANYPFTTLEPNLGMMGKILLADNPGLIEDASKGKGLGIQFLRHIEKTTLLLHCISSESPDPIKDYEIVRNEFAQYSDLLLKKEEVVVLTKSDMVDPKSLKKIATVIKNKLKKKVFTVSVFDDKSLADLTAYIESRQ